MGKDARAPPKGGEAQQMKKVAWQLGGENAFSCLGYCNALDAISPSYLIYIPLLLLLAYRAIKLRLFFSSSVVGANGWLLSALNILVRD